ncbi:hypothetical protein [Arthrobacter sp. HMWF013]|uniref:hypothetical protein n=1 Tax=Arthrobacter sp. HMWF013 TaxID=2056849 RepID=UPI000D36B989|nr:hypothetical protein [Arthrobacter sp. HMWF013]PTT69355.1 hypothetical protein DBR22_04110 [Arthrobacter sp. HMWF013]
MEPLKKIVKNQYFPAAAVLAAVVLFWVIAAFGGLSLLHNNQPPMATLTWMLFVYAAAVLTPLAGVLAGMSLVRRWLRNREAAAAYADDEPAYDDDAEPALEAAPAAEVAEDRPEPQTAPKARPAPEAQPANSQHATLQPKSQAIKKPAQSKQRKKAA